MKLKLPTPFLLLVFILSFSCTSSSSHEYKVVFKNDRNGNTLLGSKEDLISHIRSGSSIKVGWGSKGKTRSIEHLSEPIWIAVLNEQEVTVQLSPIYLGTVDWDNLSSNFSDSTKINEEWRVVITTKGEFDAVWYDKYEGKMIKRVPQRHPMTWYAKGEITSTQPYYLGG